MSIRLEMTFDSVEEMLSVFQTKILPTSTASMEVAPAPVKEEPKKAAPKQTAAKADGSKAEKPAATPAASVTDTPAPAPEPAAPAPATESPSEPVAAAPDNSVKITLEFVRAKLAELSQSGKGAAIKALIAETGAPNLSAVPAEKYAELLNKAAAL